VSREAWGVKMCKALGHPVRFRIIKFLADGPHCVCELNEDVEFSQSNLSQHLKILKEAGLVRSEKEGLKIFYQLTNPDIIRLIETIEEIAGDYLKDLGQAK
jgi:DNA-binding transcriptional ArsR family regulator